MKNFLKLITLACKTTFLILAFLTIPYSIYSQTNGEWKLKFEKANKLFTSDFIEDSTGNMIVKSFRHTPPKSLASPSMDYSSFNCIPEIETSIYTSSGEWIDTKTVKKQAGIYTEKGFVPFAKFNIPKGETVYDARYDSDGQLWMLTSKGILFCKDNFHIRFLEDIDFEKELDKLASYVLEIEGTPEFINKYVITEKEIYHFENSNFDLLLQLGKKEKIFGATEGWDNDLWVLSDNEILKCEKGIVTRYFEGSDVEIKGIYHPGLNDCFVISENAIYKLDNETFVEIKEIKKDETYILIHKDSKGRTWFVRNDDSVSDKVSGAVFYMDGKWTELPVAMVHHSKYTTAPGNRLYFRPDGKVYINGGIEIACFDGDSTQILPVHITKCPKNFLFSALCFDNSGNIYISCNQSDYVYLKNPNSEGKGGRLIKYTGDDVVYYSNTDDFNKKSSEMYIRDMLVDHRNNLWLATGFPSNYDPKGVFGKNSIIARISNTGIEVFDKTKGFNQALYKGPIYEDSKGRIWIGTYLFGLYMFEYN